jgi:hypothetical protein
MKKPEKNRYSFVVDNMTRERLERYAEKYNSSKAEVIRVILANAEKLENQIFEGIRTQNKVYKDGYLKNK